MTCGASPVTELVRDYLTHGEKVLAVETLLDMLVENNGDFTNAPFSALDREGT